MRAWTMGIGPLIIFMIAGFLPPQGISGVPCWICAALLSVVMIAAYLFEGNERGH